MTFYIPGSIKMNTISIDIFCNKLQEKIMCQPDILLIDHGEVTVLSPSTKRGKIWLTNNVPQDQCQMRSSIMVDFQTSLAAHSKAIDDGLIVDVK